MRKLKKMNLRNLNHLCHHLGISRRELEKVRSRAESYYRCRLLNDGKKDRPVATPYGRLRTVLDRLQPQLQRLELPPYLHGARRGCSIMTNAAPHASRPVLFRTDIKDYFPSISYNRVHRMFLHDQGCTPDVARVLTRLVTLDGSLPQGSPTSPIVAVLSTVGLSRRIHGLAEQRGATMTQYIDDVAISGGKSILEIGPYVERILHDEGFAGQSAKTVVLQAGDERVVTGVRVDGGIDAPSDAHRRLRAAVTTIETDVSSGRSVDATRVAKARGQLAYVGRINPGAGRQWSRRLQKVSPAAVSIATEEAPPPCN